MYSFMIVLLGGSMKHFDHHNSQSIAFENLSDILLFLMWVSKAGAFNVSEVRVIFDQFLSLVPSILQSLSNELPFPINFNFWLGLPYSEIAPIMLQILLMKFGDFLTILYFESTRTWVAFPFSSFICFLFLFYLYKSSR